VSEKRRARQYERNLAVGRAMARDHYRCRAVLLVPEVECHGRLDPHEIIPRSAWSEGIYDADNIACICRAHHHWIDNYPNAAHALGLHGYSHERTDT